MRNAIRGNVSTNCLIYFKRMPVLRSRIMLSKDFEAILKGVFVLYAIRFLGQDKQKSRVEEKRL